MAPRFNKHRAPRVILDSEGLTERLIGSLLGIMTAVCVSFTAVVAVFA